MFKIHMLSVMFVIVALLLVLFLLMKLVY